MLLGYSRELGQPLHVDDLIWLLKHTATPHGSPLEFGAGIVNMAAALHAIDQGKAVVHYEAVGTITTYDLRQMEFHNVPGLDDGEYYATMYRSQETFDFSQDFVGDPVYWPRLAQCGGTDIYGNDGWPTVLLEEIAPNVVRATAFTFHISSILGQDYGYWPSHPDDCLLPISVYGERILAAPALAASLSGASPLFSLHGRTPIQTRWATGSSAARTG